ncbi:uncharacterized protein LOC134944249 [Pseudophryne corroboree]|uniref:uncharacterized protein LOC134944249 n=1 Tax=Pseudophryne corroboree TaxID=495146 RepID=UPI003081CD06
MLKYLNYNYDGSTDVCPSLYTDSTDYIVNVFMNFSNSVPFNEFKMFNAKFNAYDALGSLSGKQMGNLFANGTAVQDTTLAVQIMAEVAKFNYAEVVSFMTECTRVAQVNNMKYLPDTSIRALLFETIFQIIIVNLRTLQDYIWFTDNCKIAFISISTKEIAQLPINMDCESQRYMVMLFSEVYGDLDDDQKTAVYNQIHSYNLNRIALTGASCGTVAGTSAAWILEYYGPYIVYATYDELLAANPNFNPVKNPT